MSEKIFRVKILDLKYLADYEHLNFKYFIYQVKSDCVEKAIKKARADYMKGMEPNLF